MRPHDTRQEVLNTSRSSAVRRLTPLSSYTAMSFDRNQFARYIHALQDDIVHALEDVQPQSPSFRRDDWTRAEGGGGRARTFEGVPDVSVFEKAGVNTSVIHGKLSPPAIKQMRTNHASLPYDPEKHTSLPFFAAGISLVLHPYDPFLPSVHANYRYFEVTETPEDSSDAPPKVLAWWFGGITDLTPAYLIEEDIRHFHRTLKDCCDANDGGNESDLYQAFKKNCDTYFFIPHRAEHRGVGGIRFDELSDETHYLLPDSLVRPRTREDIFAFVRTCADAFLPSFLPILAREPKRSQPDTVTARRWQLLRRGRSIEFNLVCDRGTKFGLATAGVRPENVLMGLPAEARWEYCCELGVDEQGNTDDSEEGRMLVILQKPVDWV